MRLSHTIFTNSERYTERERRTGSFKCSFITSQDWSIICAMTFLVVITRCIYCSYGNAYYSLNRFDAWIYTVRPLVASTLGNLQLKIKEIER